MAGMQETVPSETTTLPVGSYTAVIDASDFDLVSRHHWRPLVRRKTTYAATTIRVDGVRVVVRMHRLILGITDPKVLCDHKDRNGLNNSRANLRIADAASNAGNSTGWMRRSSRHKGVTFHPRSGKWQVRCAGKYVGLYATEDEAGRAYNAAAIEAFGEFARLNDVTAA